MFDGPLLLQTTQGRLAPTGKAIGKIWPYRGRKIKYSTICRLWTSAAEVEVAVDLLDRLVRNSTRVYLPGHSQSRIGHRHYPKALSVFGKAITSVRYPPLPTRA